MRKVGKEKGFVYCCQFLGLKILSMRRFSKIKLNVKKCEIKVLYLALCILLTIVTKIIPTLVGGSQLFKKQ